MVVPMVQDNNGRRSSAPPKPAAPDMAAARKLPININKRLAALIPSKSSPSKKL